MTDTRIKSFLRSLHPHLALPDGIEVMNPYRNPAVLELCDRFYEKYYHDNRKRVLVLGINAGRFGGGTTGISFTDPIRLENECGIKNSLPKKPELSSLFIYDFMNQYGGPDKFYAEFFLSAICPLGFTEGGRNLNYYDYPRLAELVRPFIIETLQQQIKTGMHASVCICLGKGKNEKFLRKLNEEHHFFEKIIALEHPRFIMQYRLKRKQEYVENYIRACEECVRSEQF